MKTDTMHPIVSRAVALGVTPHEATPFARSLAWLAARDPAAATRAIAEPTLASKFEVWRSAHATYDKSLERASLDSVRRTLRGLGFKDPDATIAKHVLGDAIVTPAPPNPDAIAVAATVAAHDREMAANGADPAKVRASLRAAGIEPARALGRIATGAR